MDMYRNFPTAPRTECQISTMNQTLRSGHVPNRRAAGPKRRPTLSSATWAPMTCTARPRPTCPMPQLAEVHNECGVPRRRHGAFPVEQLQLRRRLL